MSWLSEGLKKIGVSKEVQRAITKPAVATAGTFLGGPALGAIAAKMVPVSKGPAASAAVVSNEVGAVNAGFATTLQGLVPQAPTLTAPAAVPAPGWATPTFLLVVGGIGLVGLMFLATRK